MIHIIVQRETSAGLPRACVTGIGILAVACRAGGGLEECQVQCEGIGGVLGQLFSVAPAKSS